MRRLATQLVLCIGSLTGTVVAEPTLIPQTPNLSPDYFCTWNTQGYVCSYASSDAQRAAMVEQNLFGADKLHAWLELYPAVRDQLFFVMDDSWDVPLNGDRSQFGSLILNAERFPSYADGTPQERLRKLNDAVKAKGWRGVGGWICAQQAPAMAVADEGSYWTERMRWMNASGVGYWKVDWGAKDRDVAWRRMLTDLGKREAPNLVIEQAMVEGSLTNAAVYRTYDVENVIAGPVTIARVAHLLDAAPAGSPTIINCEDEPYIAAGLGAAVGVMRHPFAGAMPNGQPDFVFPASGRDLKHRLDEVTRVVNWHRIAPPLPIGSRDAKIDAATLADSWQLEQGETYTPHKAGDRRDATAPARITRGGLPLPQVEVPDGQPAPFVLASRSSNGAVAIATIGRTLDRAYVTPKANVSVEVGEANTFGLFGVFGRLTLHLQRSPANARIVAQDLAGTEAIDITSRVTIDGNALTIDGNVLAEIGLAAAQPDDRSEPGLVLIIR